MSAAVVIGSLRVNAKQLNHNLEQNHTISIAQACACLNNFQFMNMFTMSKILSASDVPMSVSYKLWKMMKMFKETTPKLEPSSVLGVYFQTL